MNKTLEAMLVHFEGELASPWCTVKCIDNGECVESMITPDFKFTAREFQEKHPNGTICISLNVYAYTDATRHDDGSFSLDNSYTITEGGHVNAMRRYKS